MNKVLPFVPKNVPLLWAPRKGCNAAWRLGAKATVVDFSKRVDTIARGDVWHALCRHFQSKYGTDWSYRFGFDFDALSDTEATQYNNVYTAMLQSRKRMG